jgi:hypothetical protein
MYIYRDYVTQCGEAVVPSAGGVAGAAEAGPGAAR